MHQEQPEPSHFEYRTQENLLRDSFHSSEDRIYCLISKKFLDAWKKSIGYDGYPTDEAIPSNLNHELLIDKANLNIILKYDPVETNMWNYVVDPNMQEGVDFEIITEAMWNYLSKTQIPGKVILRDSNVRDGRKTVNISLVKLQMTVIFPSSITKFKNNRNANANIIKGDQYVSRTCILKDYIETFQKTLQTVTGFHFVKQNSVRLYKCPAGTKYEDIEKQIAEQLKDAQYYDDPMFEIADAEYLDPEKFLTIEDCNIEPDQIIMMDGKESQKNWCVKNLNFPTEGKCEGCYNFKVLQFPCECKKVSYCTEECRKKDEQYHQSRCEKTDSDEETIDKLERTDLSVDGKCGLKNLGNTCFMNSGLQCLSNTTQLTEYILQNTYKGDVNADNPLGTKGELCSKYAHLIKRLWFGDKTAHPPFSFKKAIGKFQPQFSGYQQHDSQELITYLLDGLHEDLNRIKSKPYVEANDHQGRPDSVLAKEAWDNFRLRNDSIIVDNMYGLYKSQLKCPKCDKQSITFDPFLMINVSIPQNKMKKIELNLIDTGLLWDVKSLTIEFTKQSNQMVKDLFSMAEVKLWLGDTTTNVENYILTVTSNYHTEDITLDESLSSLKKKLKFKKFYIRRLIREEQLPDDKKIGVLIHESYRQNQQQAWKRDLTPSLTFYFPLDSTPKDIHIFILNIHIGLLKTFEGLEDIQQKILDEGVHQAYTNYIHEEVWQLEFRSNHKYQQNCQFCDTSTCNDCKVPIDSEVPLSTYLANDKDLNIEVYVVWKRGYTKDGRQEDIYDDWLKSQLKSPMQLEGTDDAQAAQQKINTNLTLQQCLTFSSQPEQLEADNTWYCNICQEHVQAFKTMQIYTTPRILIFHLKRFKNSNKHFKSKLETQIEFPIERFDMTEFVKDSNIPQELIPESQSNSPVIYDLYAISNHFGGLGGGHYTAFAKNKFDNEWYNFDDSHVTKITDVSQLLTSAAYVLFYEKRGY